MKRTLLSISVAMALTSPLTTFAADTAINPSDDFIYQDDEGSTWGGHIGTSYEYEDKETDHYDTYDSSGHVEGVKNTIDDEKTRTFELLNLYYNNVSWDFSAYYGFKLVERHKNSVGSWGKYTENESSVKQLLSLNKGFMLSNGFDSGLIYDVEFTDGEMDKTASYTGGGGYVKLGTNYQLLEHSLKPYLTYWNNEYAFGFYSNLEYIYSTEDNESDEQIEEGYSVLFKPYTRFGNWEIGVEFFYQSKDTETRSSGILRKESDYTEKYIEPIVQYSFEDAGTLYTRVRIGEKEDKYRDIGSNGWENNNDYLTDICKATIGYEQAVGDDWLLKAEYEFATEEQDKNDVKDYDLEQSTFFAQALYRF